jgi:hypothetical protein
MLTIQQEKSTLESKIKDLEAALEDERSKQQELPKVDSPQENAAPAA